jgi:transposase-like protein
MPWHASVKRTAQLSQQHSRTAFDQDTLAKSKDHWAKLIEAFQPRHTKLAELMLRAEDDVLSDKTFPKAHWRQIHSTNPLERLNKEIKHRTNVVGIPPNEQAIRSSPPKLRGCGIRIFSARYLRRF